jgi:hypothetical protein
MPNFLPQKQQQGQEAWEHICWSINTHVQIDSAPQTRQIVPDLPQNTPPTCLQQLPAHVSAQLDTKGLQSLIIVLDGLKRISHTHPLVCTFT